MAIINPASETLDSIREACRKKAGLVNAPRHDSCDATSTLASTGVAENPRTPILYGSM